MTKYTFIILSLIYSLYAFGALSDGMKPELSLTHVEDNDYLSFENFRERPRAPIAAGILINDKRPTTLKEILAVFSEDFKAFIPDGKTIKESTNNDGLPVWRYPVGTKVIHQLNFKDDKSTLFELRMIERVNDKRWAYGVYHPKEGQLSLQDYRGQLPKEFILKTKDGRPLNVKLRHIPLHVCQNCHRNTTSAPHQYQGPKDVGPCEFTPVNPKVKKDWVRAYEEAFGRSPVSK